MTTDEKTTKLESRLRGLGSLVVAYSGGVDSTFLLAIARDVLGDKVLAVTAVSPSFPASERATAEQVAKELGVQHVWVETDEMDDAQFRANPPDRCYYCKISLARKLRAVAESHGIPHVALGANADDPSDFRPGLRAAEECGLLHPLLEAGLTKAEIRELSRRRGLRTWDLPAAACLASRIPYGEEITSEKLRRIEEAEAYLRSLGPRRVRVRCHGDVARVEVDPADIALLAAEETRRALAARLKSLGFAYVTLDLEGYRMGSMNEVLGRGRADGVK